MRNLFLIISFTASLLICKFCFADIELYIYFAAEKPPTENIPAEAPSCYRFKVSSIEEQHVKLKKKYPDLRYSKIFSKNDGSKILIANRVDSNGEIIKYFYSTNPAECEQEQSKIKTASVKENSNEINSPTNKSSKKKPDKFTKTKGSFHANDTIVVYESVITLGDLQILTELLFEMTNNGFQPSSIVFLNNSGGSLIEAIKIGEFIRKAKLDTIAVQECASACIYAFAGGVNRISFTDTKFGLHQISMVMARKDRLVRDRELLQYFILILRIWVLIQKLLFGSPLLMHQT